jgi:hypothetical protein
MILLTMTLDELIEEYKQMAFICHNTDYADKKSVTRKNKAVDRMYQIVESINSKFGESGVTEFAKLIDFKQSGTDLWSSVHMLEKMSFDNQTEKKALIIIQKEAKQSLGMEYWLKSYFDKK